MRWVFLLLAIWMVTQRARLELIRREHEHVAEPERIAPVGGLQDV